MIVRTWTYLAGLLFLTLLEEVLGNGRLLVPPQRSSLWRDPRFQRNRYVFKNYDDHTLNCGGFWKLHENDGKCGVCGDAWDDEEPRANEAGGMYARGIIGRTYSTDKRFIDTLVQVTSSMSGYFEFNICPNDDVKTRVSRECLEQFPLRILSKDRSISYGRRYFPEITAGMAGIVELSLEIPEGLECTQCVLQWRWHGANNYGLCRNGRWGKGCGEQPEIYNCADIAILPESELNKKDDTMHTKKDDKPIKIKTKTTAATTTKETTTTVATTEAQTSKSTETPSTTTTFTTVRTPEETTTTTTATTAKTTTTMTSTEPTTAQSTVIISTTIGTPNKTTSNTTLVTSSSSSSAPEPTTTENATSVEPTAEPKERPSTQTAEPTEPTPMTTVAQTTLHNQSRSMINSTVATNTTEIVTTFVTSTTEAPITKVNLSAEEVTNITTNPTTKSTTFSSSESELKTNSTVTTTFSPSRNPPETQTTSTTSEPPTSPTSQMSQNVTTTQAAETTPLAEVENVTIHENLTDTTVTTGATVVTTTTDAVVNTNTEQGETNASEKLTDTTVTTGATVVTTTADAVVNTNTEQEETNASVTQSPNDLPSTTFRTSSLPTEKTDSTNTSATVITTPDASSSIETSSEKLPTSTAGSTEIPTTKSAPASSTTSEKPLVMGGIITKSDLPEGTKSEISLITLLTDLSKLENVSSDKLIGALSTLENISSSNINVNESSPVRVINKISSTDNDTTTGSRPLETPSDTNTSSTTTQAPEADNTPATEATISTAATTDAQSGADFIVTSRTTRFVQPTGGRFGGGISVARPTPIDQIVNIDLNIPGGDAHIEKEKNV